MVKKIFVLAMVKVISFLLIFLLKVNIYSQINHVNNGGFDEFTHFNNDQDPQFSYNNWEAIHYFANQTRFGNPDYKKYLTEYRNTLIPEYQKIWDEFFKPYSGDGTYYVMVPHLRNLLW